MKRLTSIVACHGTSLPHVSAGQQAAALHEESSIHSAPSRGCIAAGARLAAALGCPRSLNRIQSGVDAADKPIWVLWEHREGRQCTSAGAMPSFVLVTASGGASACLHVAQTAGHNSAVLPSTLQPNTQPSHPYSSSTAHRFHQLACRQKTPNVCITSLRCCRT